MWRRSVKSKVASVACSKVVQRRHPRNPVRTVSPSFNHVFRRPTQRKQGQEGCSVHRHGRRYVLRPRGNSTRACWQHAQTIPPPPGASGTGRTTFVNTLCESEVLAHKVCDSPETAHLEEGIRIKPVNVGTCFRAPSLCISDLHMQSSRKTVSALL